MELEISQGSWNAFISFSDCSCILARKKHQLATFLQDLFNQSELTVLSGMGITQGSDGERMILTGKFYLLGKEYREKVSPCRDSFARGTVPVGSFLCSQGLGIHFLQCFHVHLPSGFLAGSMVPFISDLQPWLLPQVWCSSSCCPLHGVGLSELGARGLGALQSSMCAAHPRAAALSREKGGS